MGRELLRQLLASGEYGTVVVLTRRSTGIVHDRLQEHLVDFDRLEEYSSIIRGDHAFCCLGTTMKKAGSREAFRKVDHDYVLAFARIASSNHVPGFSLISSLGASSKAMVFYSRVKGETEEAVSSLPFEQVNIYRPSLLLGDRKEKRTGEDIAKVVYKFISFLLPKRYRGIEAAVVARAMLRVAARSGLKLSLGPQTGVNIYPSDIIQQLGKE